MQAIDAPRSIIDASPSAVIDSNAVATADARTASDAIGADDAAPDAIEIDAAPLSSCGNNILEPGEACDDGNTHDGDCCSADCTQVTSCGGGGIDFTTGNVVGAISWNGAPITGAAATSMFVRAGSGGSTYLGRDGSYAISNIAVGSYTVGAFGNSGPFPGTNGNGGDCAITADQVASQSVVVSGNTTTTADFDITASAGRVVGSITLNGAPVALPIIEVPLLCQGDWAAAGYVGSAWLSDNVGNFEHYMPAGDFIADIALPGGHHLGSVTFTITAGQTTDLGNLNFSVGAIDGAITWNGSVVSGAEVTTMFLLANAASGTGESYVDTTGHFQISNVAADTYDVGLFGNSGPFPGSNNGGSCTLVVDELADRSVTVTAGATTAANVDITATAGQVIGSITLNGQPVANPIVEVTAMCGGPAWAAAGYPGAGWFTDGTGNFAHFLPPGDYSADVAEPNGVHLGSIPFTVIAGQTTDVGVNDYATGSITGSVTWNGSVVSGAGVEKIRVGMQGGVGADLNVDGSYSILNLLPGTYSDGLFASSGDDRCDSASTLLADANSVEVTAGATTVSNYDITATAGRVLGTITINGTPLPFPTIVDQALCGQPWSSDGSGNFENYMPVGSYTAAVSSSTGPLGTFDFSITAGQSTEVDALTTAVGSNVATAAAGGIAQVGGITLRFSSVTTAGTTTVVSSGVGPAASNGLAIVGISGQPHYWAATTSAVFSGAVSVCIHYDPSDVVGTQSNVKLVDAAAGFVDLTSSVDTINHVVCGSATSLSTFAVAEPAP